MPEKKNPITFIKDAIRKHYGQMMRTSLDRMQKAYEAKDYDRSSEYYQRYLKYLRIHNKLL